ncbi:DUF4333 domain-containing protein [Modestobacter sp. VKM Ac-2977]|uniref:DUF4333 domain-containing protein n=1 Tax=Modestobacter sp. VKM Ac-2977 TaxID=3004131 RepID=UPI0022AA501F|nr:DUF4333 domain-containing protein [Modestobacter sp. VKM Ac-2977]MCZ2820319.1 DUF4333 domain-containing protein [Modestobacter sp. VKM Ac-2977]
MSQPPQGEDPQSPWARPDREPGSPPAAPGRGGPQGGWGPPSGGPGQPPRYQGWGEAPGYGQPSQYGQPGGWGPPSAQFGSPAGWGPPAQPARRRSRPPKLVLVTLAVLLVVAALTLPSPLGATRLDPAAVERAVAGQFEAREGVALDLRCEDELPVRDSAAYSCAGRTVDGEPVSITITLTGEDGDYTWAVS